MYFGFVIILRKSDLLLLFRNIFIIQGCLSFGAENFGLLKCAKFLFILRILFSLEVMLASIHQKVFVNDGPKYLLKSDLFLISARGLLELIT